MSGKKIPPGPPFAKGGVADAPYPGLRPYREDEQGKFFGREADKAILVDKILGNRLTLLFAASGVGKSSLLQAAVIPHLKADNGENLSVVFNADWIEDPLSKVHNVIVNGLKKEGFLPDLVEQPSFNSLSELLEYCSLFSRLPLVLILDQFEESFRYHRGKEKFQLFCEQLAEVINDSSIPVSLVLSMREDFALELNAFKKYLPSVLFENFYRLEKIDLHNARRAIVLPMQQLGCSYSGGLLELLLKDLANQYLVSNPTVNNVLMSETIELPYLQITCLYLWRNRKGDVIDVAQYINSGGAAAILRDHLNLILCGFRASDKYIVDRILSCLVNYPGFKVAYTGEGLSNTVGIEINQVNNILDRLEKTRIIRKQHSKSEVWYELSHDMYSQIIREWQYSWRDTFDFAIAFDELVQKNAFKKVKISLMSQILPGLAGLIRWINRCRYNSVRVSVINYEYAMPFFSEIKKVFLNGILLLRSFKEKLVFQMSKLFDEDYGSYYFMWLIIFAGYLSIIVLFLL